jgi:tryptophan synthase beta subunit
VAETLMPLILDLEKAYADAKADPSFKADMDLIVASRARPMRGSPQCGTAGQTR